MPNLLLDIIMAMKDAIARSSLCLSYQPVIRNPWFKRKVICFIVRTMDIKVYENMHQYAIILYETMKIVLKFKEHVDIIIKLHF